MGGGEDGSGGGRCGLRVSWGGVGIFDSALVDESSLVQVWCCSRYMQFAMKCVLTGKCGGG